VSSNLGPTKKKKKEVCDMSLKRGHVKKPQYSGKAPTNSFDLAFRIQPGI
jgi:hypothetical protein